MGNVNSTVMVFLILVYKKTVFNLKFHISTRCVYGIFN